MFDKKLHDNINILIPIGSQQNPLINKSAKLCPAKIEKAL